MVLHPPGFSHSFVEGVSGNEQVGYAYYAYGDGYGRALLWHGCECRQPASGRIPFNRSIGD